MIIKLKKANSILTKLKHVLNNKTLWSVCYETFESHFCFASLVWAQNTNSVKILHLLQEKVLRTMLFQIQNSHTNPLFKEYKILKSFHKTPFQNCIIISKFLKDLLKLLSVAGSNSNFNYTLIIWDGHIFDTFKFLFAKLKPIVDIQWSWTQHMFGITLFGLYRTSKNIFLLCYCYY